MGDGAEDEQDEDYDDQSNAVFEMKSAFNWIQLGDEGPFESNRK